MKSKDFLKDLAALSATLRANIEAHYAGWDDSAAAIAARIKAVNDPVSGFEYFVTHYFPHYVRHPDKSDLHRYLFARLPRILASPGSELDAIAAPRGEAKSTIVTQLYTLYCIITGRKRYILLVMESIDQAYPMLEAIKTELSANPRLAIDFPNVAGGGRVWQAGTIVTGNNIKVQVAGSGKKLRGLRHGAYRPDLVILDDLENDEQVLSPTQRDKLHGWLKRTVLPLGAAGEKMDVVYIGTILHYDSVLARTLANSGWTTARFRAVIRWPDNMALWDEWEARWQTDRDAANRYYAEHRAEMDQGAVVSWSARPILELMKLARAMVMPPLTANTKTTRSAVRMRPLPMPCNFGGRYRPTCCGLARLTRRLAASARRATPLPSSSAAINAQPESSTWPRRKSRNACPTASLRTSLPCISITAVKCGLLRRYSFRSFCERNSSNAARRVASRYRHAPSPRTVTRRCVSNRCNRTSPTASSCCIRSRQP